MLSAAFLIFAKPDSYVAQSREISARYASRRFDAIYAHPRKCCTQYFKDVLVPEPEGISMYAARRLTREFADAHSFEFVEYAPTGDAAAQVAVRELVGIVANQ